MPTCAPVQANGGDLHWAQLVTLPFCGSPSPTIQSAGLIGYTLGPSGDIVTGSSCPYWSDSERFEWRDASGALLRAWSLGMYNIWTTFTLTARNDLVYGTQTTSCAANPSETWLGLNASGMGAWGFIDTPNSCAIQGASNVWGAWAVDGQRNGFLHITNVFNGVSTVERRGLSGGKIYPAIPGALAADGPGNLFLYGKLASIKNLGCGPMTPATATTHFITAFAPSGACAYSRTFADAISVQGLSNGGALLTTLVAGVDLGCGQTSVAGGMSIARLDAAGNCVFARSYPAAGLSVRDDAQGNVFVMGPVAGGAAIDFGGGPLMGIGARDVVVAKLDPQGNHVWSKRFGDGGTVTTFHTMVTNDGGVALDLEVAGTIDFGAGAVVGSGANGVVVARFDTAGSLLWARNIPLAGVFSRQLDKCGALVVSSVDPAFDPGSGPLGLTLPKSQFSLARFAP